MYHVTLICLKRQIQPRTFRMVFTELLPNNHFRHCFSTSSHCCFLKKHRYSSSVEGTYGGMGFDIFKLQRKISIIRSELEDRDYECIYQSRMPKLTYANCIYTLNAYYIFILPIMMYKFITFGTLFNDTVPHTFAKVSALTAVIGGGVFINFFWSRYPFYIYIDPQKNHFKMILPSLNPTKLSVKTMDVSSTKQFKVLKAAPYMESLLVHKKKLYFVFFECFLSTYYHNLMFKLHGSGKRHPVVDEIQRDYKKRPR